MTKPFFAAASALLLIATIAASYDDDGSSHRSHSPAPVSCLDQLLEISPCLPTVAEAPDASSVPSAACCANLLSAFDGGACLCHLVREPFLLGFPINGSRLVSLFSSCGRPAAAAASFRELCLGSQTLPLFRNSAAEGLVSGSRPPYAEAPPDGGVRAPTSPSQETAAASRNNKATSGARAQKQTAPAEIVLQLFSALFIWFLIMYL